MPSQLRIATVVADILGADGYGISSSKPKLNSTFRLGGCVFTYPKDFTETIIRCVHHCDVVSKCQLTSQKVISRKNRSGINVCYLTPRRLLVISLTQRSSEDRQ